MTCTDVRRMHGKVERPAKPRDGRIVIGVLLAVLLVCVAVGAALHLRNISVEQPIDLEATRNEFVQELQDNMGEYDAQSIVLANTSRPVAQALAEKLGATLRITKDGSFATLTLPEGSTILDVAMSEDYLADLPKMSADYQVRISDLIEGEEDEDGDGERLPMRPTYTVSDTSYELQAYLDYLNMQNVWTYTQGSGITVAVIDTGIDTDHPEFVGRISEYSYNATEDKIVKDYTTENGSLDWSLVEDEQGHGTAVAGVIAAAMDGNGIVGIAPQVNIIVIKAECNEAGEFERVSDLVFGLYYAIERDVSVVNMSFGTYSEENPFAAATQLALDSDILCVAAAGNDQTATLCWPAADPNVFGIGALETNGWQLAEYSNYGENVDFVAPGTVYTTKMGGGYGGINGTSFASPITAGVIALYMSQNRYAEFNMIQELLYASCYDLGDLGPDFYYGYGALDVSALMLEERGTVTFNMMTDELDNTQQVFIRNHTLQNMPEPERLYAIFEGWYYDPQCTEEYNWYADEFSSNLTLYANWVNEDDGVPFTYVILDDGTIEIRSYTGHRRFITIPDYIEGRIVSSIGEEAFKGETRLREIKLPKYLKRIRRSAFEGCSNLVSMEIPDTVTEIGDKAFYDNVRLSTLIFGQESQLISIGNFAFSGCAKMRTFTVPSKVTTLNATAFFRNTSMIAFDVQQGNTSFTAKDGVLYNNTGSTLVCYPAGLKGTFVVPGYVRTVGDYAFAYTKLNGVELSSVEMLGGYAFAYGSLKSIVIPDSVTSMGKCAFSFNLNMRSAKLGRGLTDISAYSFSKTALTAIEIPNGIQSIDTGAFSNIGTLAVVNFEQGSNLIYIGQNAFFDSGVVSVEIPASVVTIDVGAFGALCFPYLESLTFEEGSALYAIGCSAFSSQIHLTEVDLPERLSYLGDFSFSETGLMTVDIPASVTCFGAGAFASCHSLTDIWVEDANEHYLDVDGVVYSTQKDMIVAYPAGNARTEYAVLEGVTDIGEASFFGSWNLQHVDLASTVITVRNQAFCECINVNSYGLSDVLTYIQEYAFYKNYSLLTMSMPDSLMQIGRYAFAEDWSLYSVAFHETAKLPRISFGSFAYCGLTSFRVPANVSTMAQGAFEGCSKLQSFTFAKNSKLESISAYMFDGCSNLRTITFEKGNALTSIQAHGLEGMRKLTTIDFGDAKLTNIDNFAFRFCESLTRFDIPEGVTFLGRYAFYYCTNLSEVTVPATMDFIGRFAFLGTKDLNIYFAAETLPANLAEDWDHGTKGYYLGVTDVVTEGDWKYATLTSGGISIIEYLGDAAELDMTAVDFGGDIINIGGSAFAYSTVERVVLPETLQIIQAEAFAYSKLQSISIPASVTFIGREAFTYTPIETLTFAPNSQLKTIEQSAFEKAEKLESVVIPASLTTMGRAVFKSSGITSLTFAEGFAMTEIPEEVFAYTHISTVTIPDSVTLINHNAFREIKELKSVTLGSGEELMIMSNVFYQSGLETVYIPENVGYVGEYAFVALPNLTEFQVSENNPYYKAVDGLLVSKNGRKLIAVPAGRTGSLTVPEGIEVIGFGAFEDSQLSEIKFLDNANILTFGYRAFYNVDGITQMHIPASVVAIDYYAFAMCDNLQTVTFAEDNNLKGVYEGAFYGCKNLSDIMLPDSIVEISDFAFYGCRKLTDVPVSETTGLKGIYDYAFAYAGFSGDYTTPETLIDIGPYAFMGNQFTSITVPDTNYWDLVIGIGAFAECNELEEITLPFIGASFEDNNITWFGYIFGAGGYQANSTYVPESLKRVTITEEISFVGRGGFYNLAFLESIDIPHSVTLLCPFALGGTTARYQLTNEITIISSNYSYENTTEQSHFGTGIYGELRLAPGITRIGFRSFSGCVDLTSVLLPEGIISIEGGAFENTGITTIDIPNSVTSIGESAFKKCSNLTTIIIPYGITKIGQSTFYGCWNLRSVEIPDTLKSIERSAFENTAIEFINIPDGVTSIGIGAFSQCVNLTSVSIPESVETIHMGAFQFCSNLIDVELSDNIVSIPERCFYKCQKLTSIRIPGKVTSIGANAFFECLGLQSVINDSDLDILVGSESYGYVSKYAKKIVDKHGNTTYKDDVSGFEYIDTVDGFRFEKENEEYRLIAYLGDLETVILPTSVNGNSYDIYCMTGVRNVVIPDGVTRISKSAFEDANMLVSIQMPNSVIEIGEYAFSGCTSIQNITLPENLEKIENYAFAFCSNLESIELPDSLITMGSNVFYSCNSLEKVKLPDSLTVIKPGTFANCKSLETITIPDSVTVIYGDAFRECVGLKMIDIPDSVTELEKAFTGCSALSHVRIGKSLEYIQSGAFSGCDILDFQISEENLNFKEIEGVVYNKEVTKVIFIPNSITEFTIPDTFTMIHAQTFEGCSQLISVTIPDTVTIIGNSAFSECTSLESISIPDGVESIGSSVFYNCFNLKSVYIPESVTIIRDRAFLNCESLESLDIPSGVQSIGKSAFGGCKNLISINLPAGLSEISDFLFSGCTELTSVVIPEGVTVIGDHAFYNCTSIRSVLIPNSVNTIEECAFYNCTMLKGIRIPDGITEIEALTFYRCDSLTSIEIPDGVTTIGNSAFYSCQSLTGIEFPESLTYIGNNAFEHSNLMSVAISSNVSIGENAFQSCNNLCVIYNNSDMNLNCGAVDNGYIAQYAKLIVDKNGNQTYADVDAGFQLIDTPDGFRFIKENGKYTLRAYTGKDEIVTLPLLINGCEYEIQNMSGVEILIVPNGMKRIDNNAFRDSVTLRSVVLPDSLVSIGNQAFWHCENLRNIQVSSNITDIGYATFSGTAYEGDISNWQGGCLYIGDCLITASEDAVYIKDNINCIATGALDNSYSLKKMFVKANDLDMLNRLTNLETLVIREMPNSSIWRCFGSSTSNIPITLKNIVLVDGVSMRENAFTYITGITIYVEATEDDTRWDENFPGWNNGNKVVYGDEWINADFYDQNGNLMSSEIFLTHQVIRQPYLELEQGTEKSQVLVGWDIDGDDKPDTIPATSTVDIVAYPVIETKATEYVVKFYDADGETLISKVTLPYGAIITPPTIAQKQGYITGGWIGYTEGMTVSGNHTFVLDRVHMGDGHDYAAPIWVAPTCTEQGYYKHACSICGEWYATDYADALGHDYTATVLPAACTELGTMTYTCKVCGHTYSENTPPKGHNYAGTVTKQATCTKAGEMLYTCTDCGHSVTETMSLAAHDYQKKTAPKWWLQILIEHLPNVFFGYEDDSVYYYECTQCKRIQTAEEASSVTSSGAASVQSAACFHELGDWSEYIAPTCMGEGVDARFCAVCEKPIEFRRGADAGDHDMGEWYQFVAPTCTTEGENRRDCSRCDLFETEVVSANGHTEGDVVVENNVAPTCTGNGSYDNVVYCTVCGDELSRETIVVDALGHTPADAVEENRFAPTCTQVGGYDMATYCAVCGVELSREHTVIDALGHTPADVVIENRVEPTCTDIGTYENVVYCSVCHAELSREQMTIPATGHSHEAVITAPTCTEQGYTTHTCHCGDSYVDSEVDALDHTPSDWIVDTEPAIGIAGSKHKECTTCGEVLETEIIDALTEAPTTEEPTTEAPITDAPTTEATTVEQEPKGNCNGIVSVPVVLLALLSCFAVAWRPRKDN